MGKRGPKPFGRVSLTWSGDFAYALGVIASDGCLYNDGRHISITSKDEEMVVNIRNIFGLTNKFSMKGSGINKEKKYFNFQFSDVALYNFLISVGITPRKSKTILKVDVPKEFFFDFLRGMFDGDGCIYSYFDKRWRSSFMVYISFVSASKPYIEWLRLSILEQAGIRGHITYVNNKSYSQLKYAKTEALILIKKMYHKKVNMYLSRKKLKIDKILDTMHENVLKYKMKKDRYY